jgi:hypothetical protein
MLRKILILAAAISSFSAFAIPAPQAACTSALPTNNSGFCASFRASAQCHCMERLPSGVCQDVNTIYNRMINMFGNQQAACVYQSKMPGGTTPEICNDDWNCFRLGGHDSQGRLCSGSGKACS